MDVEVSWANETLLGLDFEATSVDPLTTRPVTVSLVEVAGDGTLERVRGAVLNCDVEVPEEAAAIHGYTTERVKEEGREPKEVFEKLIVLLDGARKDGIPVCAYNAKYDITLLHAEAERHGLTVPEFWVIDPLVMDRALDKYRKGRRTLTAACEHYFVELNDAHTASADAIAAVGVARQIGRTYASVFGMTPEELHLMQQDWFVTWRDDFNKYLTKQGKTDLVTGSWPR